MAATSERGPVTVRSMLPILGASTIGTAIEWYDFFLYGFLAATVFPKLFFPELDPVAGTIAAFTTNFVGFLARPIGGAFFGWFGDRVGRKSTLIATLLLMGIATALMGLLPGYAQIGLAAPLLLSILRFLQGAGVGGEWGGSVLLSMEFGDDRRRGFWTSWPQTGVPVGLALSALAGGEDHLRRAALDHHPAGFDHGVERERGAGLALAPPAVTAVHEEGAAGHPIPDGCARAMPCERGFVVNHGVTLEPQVPARTVAVRSPGSCSTMPPSAERSRATS